MGHLLLEINTRCWLGELSAKLGQRVTLEQTPETEFASWQTLGVTHIWLMGVWRSGPRARAQALQSPEQRASYSEALPDWREEDVVGSPYAIAEYRVLESLGGEAGLKAFRTRLN
ncbi:MAG: alpha-amylase family glycosyl hydrolase, partial [Limisphaerales bacterium]